MILFGPTRVCCGCKSGECQKIDNPRLINIEAIEKQLEEMFGKADRPKANFKDAKLVVHYPNPRLSPEQVASLQRRA